ncbi:hypothetical protein ACH5RR_007046 [Cinchona calisaya]|uniref:Uncharacterized protein n=1 Tax=Cinchona calisaya TaxID=153742 RepID=A0ABD3AQT9_9GENT
MTKPVSPTLANSYFLVLPCLMIGSSCFIGYETIRAFCRISLVARPYAGACVSCPRGRQKMYTMNGDLLYQGDMLQAAEDQPLHKQYMILSSLRLPVSFQYKLVYLSDRAGKSQVLNDLRRSFSQSLSLLSFFDYDLEVEQNMLACIAEFEIPYEEFVKEGSKDQGVASQKKGPSYCSGC